MTTSPAPLADLLAHDASDMLGAVALVPTHLVDGYERGRTAWESIARTWPTDEGAGAPTPRALVVCGMGGSGVGADLVAAACELGAPLVAVKGYDLPEWVDDQDIVVCASYSGATAETLACYRAAANRSVVGAVVTTGGELADLASQDDVPVVDLPTGLQPRAAVGELFGALVAVAEAFNVVEHGERSVEHAAAGAQLVVDEHTGTGPEHGGDAPPALAFARELADHLVVIFGSGHTEAVAHRWKAQINENAKVPAHAASMPELDHNELVGWEHARATGARWALVELMPHDVSDPVALRFDVTRELIADALDADIRLTPSSTTLAGATFEHLVWGDYVSIYLALLRGIDPTPVDRIHTLKSRLAGS